MLRRGGGGRGGGRGGRIGFRSSRPMSSVSRRYYGFHTYAYAGAACLHTDKVCIKEANERAKGLISPLYIVGICVMMCVLACCLLDCMKKRKPNGDTDDSEYETKKPNFTLTKSLTKKETTDVP